VIPARRTKEALARTTKYMGRVWPGDGGAAAAASEIS
jgi:hypothetical protein